MCQSRKITIRGLDWSFHIGQCVRLASVYKTQIVREETLLHLPDHHHNYVACNACFFVFTRNAT